MNTNVDRKSVLRLPLAERNRILQEQAEAMVNHYQEDDQWREWTDLDSDRFYDYDACSRFE
ncbi:hypothetical protein [Roseofilum sp. Guam]|uniref:hypothetical protein n=1 Tax=Roseofilum sp. Guam TaxID=2821502 RepID=UPI001B0F8B64|nr:hypothetical protein [Roseofilum sp. Guam]MBP0027778.1 hypothetical protein [Roseofilum sp. Guam]